MNRLIPNPIIKSDEQFRCYGGTYVNTNIEKRLLKHNPSCCLCRSLVKIDNFRSIKTIQFKDINKYISNGVDNTRSCKILGRDDR